MKKEYNHIWARIGMTLFITPEEMEKIVHASDEKQKVLARIFAEGRALIESDSYIPGPAIEHYNETYGTCYEKDEVDLDMELLSGKLMRLSPNCLQKDRGDTR